MKLQEFKDRFMEVYFNGLLVIISLIVVGLAGHGIIEAWEFKFWQYELGRHGISIFFAFMAGVFMGMTS